MPAKQATAERDFGEATVTSKGQITVPNALRLSLAIEHVLGAPYARNALRDVITNAGFDTKTTKMPVL